jgi:predicted DNA-binding protein (MmcQ/YjbR family)
LKLDQLRQYLLAQDGATEEFPFGPTAMVFKVMGKMFASISIEKDPLQMNLKCNPELALHLREKYAAILPGYHMNKKHWNTLVLDGSLTKEDILAFIDDSYKLVVKNLTKAQREQLGQSFRR